MSKRGHNEGSIFYHDGLQRWSAAVSLGYDLNGKRKRKYVYGKTRKEVAEKLKELHKDQQLGLPITSGRQTLGKFLDQWLTDVARPNLRPSTYATYQLHVRNHISPALGRIPLQQLGPQDIQSFINAKLATGLAPRTVGDIHAVLRTALTQAVKWGLVARNVATLVNRPRIPKKQPTFLTPEQSVSFIEASAGDRYQPLFITALSIGLRRGEALGLRWEDVDFERGVITLRQAMQRVEGKLRPVELKTHAAHRSINLPGLTIAALRRQRVHQMEDRLLAGSTWNDTGLVFTSRLGTPIDPRNYKRALDRALHRAGLHHIRIHDMRHTAASLMLSQNISPKVISEVLGHARVGITLDIYSHLYEPMRQEAAARMDEALGGARAFVS
jgi:integrase